MTTSFLFSKVLYRFLQGARLAKAWCQNLVWMQMYRPSTTGQSNCGRPVNLQKSEEANIGASPKRVQVHETAIQAKNVVHA